MQGVVYADCHIYALYAECHYTECRYAECLGAQKVSSEKGLILISGKSLLFEVF